MVSFSKVTYKEEQVWEKDAVFILRHVPFEVSLAYIVEME